jgi:hypothetical protein
MYFGAIKMCGGRKKEKTPSAKRTIKSLKNRQNKRQILGRLPRNGEKI